MAPRGFYWSAYIATRGNKKFLGGSWVISRDSKRRRLCAWSVGKKSGWNNSTILRPVAFPRRTETLPPQSQHRRDAGLKIIRLRFKRSSVCKNRFYRGKKSPPFFVDRQNKSPYTSSHRTKKALHEVVSFFNPLTI